MERILKGKSDRSQSKVGMGEAQMQMAKQMGNQATAQMYQDIIQFELISLHQSGPNCGMFAMAMAIQEFIGGDGNVIAQELQERAVDNGYSNLGEMFDADSLAVVGAGFCLSKGLKCASVQFNTQQQLNYFFSKNEEGKLRILFPYASLGAIPQTGADGIGNIEVSDAIQSGLSVSGEDEHLRPGNMSHAHWSVINKTEDFNAVEILEGNQIMNDEKRTAETLFASNQILGDQFDWRAYLKSLKMQLYKLNRYKGDPRYDQEKLNSSITSVQSKIEIVQRQVGAKPVIDVNLRGRVVLVGRPGDVDAAIGAYQDRGGSL